MKWLNKHIVLTLIAIFATNIFFLMWLIIDGKAISVSIAKNLSFIAFIALSNIGLLLVSVVSLKYSHLAKLINEKGYSSWLNFLIQVGLSIMVFYIGCIFSYAFFNAVENRIDFYESLGPMKDFATNNYLLALVVFFSFTGILVFFISNLEIRMGSVNRLLQQSMGYTIHPKVVRRGFMFIDLNDATALAEKLHRQAYANLLRDCFRMLEDLVELTPFEVYQYVGDEAVITFDPSHTLNDLRSIQLFMDFKAYLFHQNNYFLKHYQVTPTFKCAVHQGQVVQSEIGKGVRHLVYHGDVLNTCSRMLSSCQKHDADLLISDATLICESRIKKDYEITPIYNNIFKGKMVPLTMHKVRSLAQTDENKFFYRKK